MVNAQCSQTDLIVFVLSSPGSIQMQFEEPTSDSRPWTRLEFELSRRSRAGLSILARPMETPLEDCSRTAGGRVWENWRTKAEQMLYCLRAAGDDCVEDPVPLVMLRQAGLFCPALRARVAGVGAKSLT